MINLSMNKFSCTSQWLLTNVGHVLDTDTSYNIKQREYEVLLIGIVTDCEVLL